MSAPCQRILVAALALGLLWCAVPAQAQTCGVLELTGGGKKITKNVVVNITSLIVSEVDIQGDFEFTMQHGADEFDNGCPASNSCLVKFANDNGYERLIVGSVTDGSRDGAFKLKVRLFDPSSSSFERTVEDEVESAPESMLVDIPPLVGELLTGERPKTAADILAEQADEQDALDMDVDLLALNDADLFGDDDDLGDHDLDMVDLEMSEEEIRARQEEERLAEERAEEERRARAEDDRRAREEEERLEREQEERRAREEEERLEREERARREREDEERRAREDEARRERDEEARRAREEEERRRSYDDEDDEDDEDLIIVSDAGAILIGDEDEDDYDSYSDEDEDDDRYGDDEDDYDSYGDDDEDDYDRYDEDDDDDSYGDDDEDDDYDYGRYDEGEDEDDDYDFGRYEDDDDDDSDSDDYDYGRYDEDDDRDRGRDDDGDDYDVDYDVDRGDRRGGRDEERFDEGRSRGGRSTYHGESDLAHVCIKASLGGSYYYQGFFSYGGDIGIHVHRNVLIDVQFKGWTAGVPTQNPTENKVATLIPLALGASYKGMRGMVHPYVGGDAVFVLYYVDPDIGALFAPGFKVRGGADFKITETFGFFVGLNLGFAHARRIRSIDKDYSETAFIFDGGAGIMIQL